MMKHEYILDILLWEVIDKEEFFERIFMKKETVNNVLARTKKVLVDVVFCFAGISTKTINDWDEHHNDRVKEAAAKAAAKASIIFRKIAQPGSEYIKEKDLLRFMEKDDVYLVFNLIEGADSGRRRIDRNSLKQWLVMVYTGRKALDHGLDDTKAVVAQVDALGTSIVIVISFVVFLLLLEIATTNLLVLISSQLVLAAFAFGNTCKNVFESIMFLFVAHPFDIGDRIVLDGVPVTHTILIDLFRCFRFTLVKICNTW